MGEAETRDGAFTQIEVEHRGEVPVFWADAPGPKQVALAFRVGRADEVLAQFGLSHAVEHLAMFPLGRPDYMCNAFVDDTRTVFFAEGTEQELARFLERVCASLSDLPLARLDTERRVLQTEAANEPGSFLEHLLGLRFGPAGFGLSDYKQLGLRWIGADRVSRWAAERFTAGNAAVWMTCRPPESLELALPPGEPIRPPEPRPLPALQTPSYLAEGSGRVSLSFMAPRTSEMIAAGAVASERLHERLRVEQGISYGIDGSYVKMTAELAHGHLGADCLDENAAGVVRGLVLSTSELASTGPTDEELTRHKQIALRGMAHPESTAAALDGAVTNHLFGAPLQTPAELAEEVRALEPGPVMEAMRGALASALLVAPEALPVPPQGYTPYSTDDGRPPIQGRTFRARRQGIRQRMRRPKGAFVLGDDGVGIESPGEDTVAVRFEDCVAAVEESPDAIRMIDHTGSWVLVSASGVEQGDELVAAVRGRIPEELFVPLPPAAAAVEELAVRLTNRPNVEGELQALAEQLGDDEPPVALVEATRNMKVGLLAATERRVVWLWNGRAGMERLELTYDQLQGANYDGSGNRTLELVTYPQNVTFEALTPADAGRELAAAVTSRLSPGGGA